MLDINQKAGGNPTIIPSLGPRMKPKEAVAISIRFGFIFAMASAGKTVHCTIYMASTTIAVTTVRLVLNIFIKISPILSVPRL